MKHSLTLILLLLLALVPFTTIAQDSPDTVVLVWPSQPDSLFPDYAVTATAGYSMQLVYSSLVTTDLSGNIVPDLAESWEVSDDNLTWTFKLREDVTWHDGEPFTAEDVSFSFEITADPEYTGGFTDTSILGVEAKQSGESETVEGLEMIDDYRVAITTVEPNALVLETIGIRDILPAHLLQDIPVSELGSSDQATMPVGTGPYRLVEWRTDEALVFEAYEGYFGTPANIPNFIWKVVPELATHYTELVTDASDISTSITADDFAAIAEEPGVTTLQLPGVNQNLIIFNTSTPYFSDVRVRQAIAHALDRESMIAAVSGGFGTISSSLVHPSLPELNDEIDRYAFDVELAQALLAEAGWRDDDGDGVIESYGVEGLEDGTPFSVELGTWSNPLYSLPAQIIQQNLQEVGIMVEINVVDFNVYFSEYLTTNNPDFQFGMSGWFNLIFPPQSELAGNFVNGSDGYNRSLWSDERVDEILTVAPSEFDVEARSELYHEVQAILHEAVPFLYLIRPDNLIAFDGDLVIPEVQSLTGLFQSIPQWSWAQ